LNGFSFVDERVLQRLSAAVLAARGDRTQREFAALMGVAQSTVQGWESRKNYPSLEGIEKIAQIRGERPEEFVAYLYGRSISAADSVPVEVQISAMTRQEVSLVAKAVADWLAHS
jgi:transcriptional regulator with XRE-family HTH domain